LPAPIVNGEEDSLLKWPNWRLSKARDLDLDRIILHTVMHDSPTSTYVASFTEIEETFCWRTDGRTDIETHVIYRSTRSSRPKNWVAQKKRSGQQSVKAVREVELKLYIGRPTNVKFSLKECW